jgi:Domain of unknown function (DUF4386)
MTSDDKHARLAGLLYLILLLTAGPAYFSGRLGVTGDAAGTLAGIQAGRTLFEVMIIAGVVGFVDYLILAAVLYRVFSRVGKNAATLMLIFVVASVPLSLAALARRTDVLSLLDGAKDLGLSGDQLAAQVMLAMRSANGLMQLSIIFWGLWLFPLGWLILRSGFVPKVLGILLMVGGFFYILAFVGTVIEPAYDSTLFARIVGIISGVPDMVGELGTGLWLLVKGASNRRTFVLDMAGEV